MNDKTVSSDDTAGKGENLDAPYGHWVSKTVKQVSEKDFIYKGKYPFERTDSGFKCGTCPATSIPCEAKGSCLWDYVIENIRRWHLDSLRTQKASSMRRRKARQKCRETVEETSENKFIYNGKFTFERVDAGFNCGSCPATSKCCKLKGQPLWSYIISHIKMWHLDSDRVRKIKVQQRFTEIAPDRFHYGKYLVEKHDNKYRCVTCGYLVAIGQGKDKFKLINSHINRKHENTGKNMCELCGMLFSASYALKIHKITQHDQSNASFPCSSCEKTFKTQIQAHQHENQVHKERYFNFICEICGQKFRCRTNLQGHVAFFHNGQKIFKCNECGKAYGSSRSLAVHQNSHTGQRKYACDVCGMQFSQAYSIKRHKMTAHKD